MWRGKTKCFLRCEARRPQDSGNGDKVSCYLSMERRFLGTVNDNGEMALITGHDDIWAMALNDDGTDYGRLFPREIIWPTLLLSRISGGSCYALRVSIR